MANRGSILLARKPRYTDCRNDTTATAQSKGGYAVAVTFWVQDPPNLSFFSIHCTKPPHDSPRHFDFDVFPHVVGLDGPFVLLRAGFSRLNPSSPWTGSEYFLYKAGAPPSLTRIPTPADLGRAEVSDLDAVTQWGILGRPGGHYLLAALDDAPATDDTYRLRIYSSEAESWSTRLLQNPCSKVDRVMPHKVITLGQQQGLLAWVDFSLGMLVCDLPALLLQHPPDDPVTCCCFIPLPHPLPGNTHKFLYPFAPTRKQRTDPSADTETRSAVWFRDLACVNGVLKFVEMENNPSPHPQNKDDADLIMQIERKPGDLDHFLQSYFRDAWRAVTWTRKLVWPPPSLSSNFWRHTSAAHVADIEKGAPPFPVLRPEDGGAPPLLAFSELYSAFPILSPEDGDDTIYLKSLREPTDKIGWVAALDVGNKALKAIGKYSLPDDEFSRDSRHYDPDLPFRASTLSRHLDITPGIEVSAYRKISVASSSANCPSSTSIHVDQLSSSTRRSEIQRLSELDGRSKRARNNPKSMIQNQHISQGHPVGNYLTQQQTWGASPVYPLWFHENNQQTQQCFSKLNGPCDPGYASLPPLIHGDHTYQPLRPPSEHHLTSSSEFKPQEAPHEYSQQLSALNPFAYGAHKGYVNYQQQWPIGASWQQPPPSVQRQPTP